MGFFLRSTGFHNIYQDMCLLSHIKAVQLINQIYDKSHGVSSLAGDRIYTPFLSVLDQNNFCISDQYTTHMLHMDMQMVHTRYRGLLTLDTWSSLNNEQQEKRNYHHRNPHDNNRDHLGGRVTSYKENILSMLSGMNYCGENVFFFRSTGFHNIYLLTPDASPYNEQREKRYFHWAQKSLLQRIFNIGSTILAILREMPEFD